MKKLLYTLCITIMMLVIPANADDSWWKANPWNPLKYFTAAYWLPYTCGNQFELDAEKDWTKKSVEQFNEKKLTKNLSKQDFLKLVNQQNNPNKKCQLINKKIEHLQPKSFFSTAYLLRYTCGNQLEIDDLIAERNNIKE